MEHAKKMLLIEPSVIEKLKKNDSFCDDSLSRLDKEMHKIINSKLEDREKWALYFQTLQRYLHISEEKNYPIRFPVVTNDEESEKKQHKVNAYVQTDPIKKEEIDKVDHQVQTEPVGEEGPSNKHAWDVYSDSYLLKLIPKTFKKKGEILIKSLAQNPDKIRWDNKGTVFINNNSIPNSNIIDLLNDALRQLKQPRPVAWESFAKTLFEIGVPLNCIGNRETQEYVRKLHVEDLGRPFIGKTPNRSPVSTGSKHKRKIDWERWTPY